MTSATVKEAWENAEAQVAKGSHEEALDTLRKVWGEEGADVARTFRIAGDAKAGMARKAGAGARSMWREAISHYDKALAKNSNDKQARRARNSLLAEMDGLGIRAGGALLLWDDGAPTMTGIFAMLVAGMMFLVALKVIPEYLAGPLEYDAMIEIELYPDQAPRHVENFKLHSTSGAYQDVVFHRIIDDFMIQGGDIENKRGSGGYAAKWYGYCNGQAQQDASGCDTNAYTVPDEADNGLTHVPGMLSMAKTSSPHTGGSQWFFVDAGSTPSHLDGVHTVFGKAISGEWRGNSVTGIDVIDHISRVSTDGQDYPTEEVPTILRVEIDGNIARMYIDLAPAA